jgi:hypothetical protein
VVDFGKPNSRANSDNSGGSGEFRIAINKEVARSTACVPVKDISAPPLRLEIVFQYMEPLFHYLSVFSMVDFGQERKAQNVH